MTAESFEIDVSYWPASVAMYWWERPAVDVSADFDAARAAGIQNLGIDLLWNDFQPDRERVALGPMRHLEQVLNTAWDRGMQLRPTFFPVTIGRYLWLPGWTLQPGTVTSARVIAGHHLTSLAAYNLFTDKAVVDAEARLVREVVSAFGQHPSVSGWVLGRALTAASPVPSPEIFEQWLGLLSATARQAGATQAMRHDITTQDLICHGRLAPEAASRVGVEIGVDSGWKPAWADLPDAEWAGWVAAYARSLAGVPVSIRGVNRRRVQTDIKRGGPRQDGGEAEEIEAGLSAVHEAGGAGAIARSLMDYCDDLRRSPPFREDPELLTDGLFTAARVPKDALMPWAAWSSRRELVVSPLVAVDIDPEERHANPETVARDCYEAYTR